MKYSIQKHDASNLHYDFRLEMDGTMKSWAIPKGPSLDSKDNRLAIEVDDHSIDYADFEGRIEEGYGKGKVLLWDKGEYELIDKKDKKIVFSLKGKKLKGKFSLIKFKEPDKWLLIKKKDEYSSKKDILKEKPNSVKSGKSLKEI